ncbi:FxsB family cyclophane-forming radical SAM/SPASM peptide maturase [Nonomuraea sp. NPDC050153]|uniref:FxsB family cyclophane-forming radical SAM/SPASM peptide maturase n=1 Tax=Nonomuraea sp. NPDC050153 TaxID=3364359 RepID=UPI0037B27751
MEALRRAGWQPLPFTQFVIKIHSRCNLACDYCYMYEMADQSWSSRDKVMTPATMKATIDRIAEHARAHGLPSVNVVLHGGEPLLAGASRIKGFVAGLRDALEPDAQVEVGMQTNGTLIDEDFLAVAAAWRIGLSVSLDGAEQDNDRHRRYAGGRGSYETVARGLALLGSALHRPLFRGLLCTIDLDNDPIATYEELLRWRPPAVDFLLPHGTWSSPPPKRTADEGDTPYADWLLEIFERWYTAPNRQTRVRLFESVIRMALGGHSLTEAIGLQPARLLVIETDGSIEQVDSLKAAFDGAPDTGLNVRDHPFDRALDHPSVAVRQIGLEALSEQCRACSLSSICGGGLYPHRYREGRGFLNPSVYCPDLMKLISHIVGRVKADT